MSAGQLLQLVSTILQMVAEQVEAHPSLEEEVTAPRTPPCIGGPTRLGSRSSQRRSEDRMTASDSESGISELFHLEDNGGCAKARNTPSLLGDAPSSLEAIPTPTADSTLPRTSANSANRQRDIRLEAPVVPIPSEPLLTNEITVGSDREVYAEDTEYDPFDRPPWEAEDKRRRLMDKPPEQ